MRTKKYEFDVKDKNLLKKDIGFRFVFIALFLSAFIWQFAMLLISKTKNELDFPKILVAFLVIFTSLILIIIGMMYISKELKTLDKIKHHGKAVESRSILFSDKKGSFLKLYKFLCEFIAVVMLLLLVCCFTYSLLEFIHYSTVSYYMPLMLLITLTGFNTVFHINNELTTIKTVREFNSIY